MKRLYMRAALLSLFIVFQFLLSYGQDMEFLRDQNWLLANLDEPTFVVLHVGDMDDYDKGHVPGAQLITPDEFRINTEELRWEIPPIAYLDSVFRSKGITNKTTNVLYYGNDNFALTYRLYFTLDYLGLGENTFIINGGLKAWQDNDLPITIEAPSVVATSDGELKLKPNAKLLADKDLVRKSIDGKKITIIDARRPEFYDGENDGGGRYQRSGHIASSANITWLDLIDENQYLRSSEDLQNRFRSAGVKENNQVIAYCHVGLRASVIYTLSKGLGHKAKLYDGSYNEWDKLSEEYPIQKK